MQKITIFRIARKSITRKFFRSAAIAFAVAVVAATLFSVTTVMGSVESSLRKGTARLGADIMVVPAEAEALAKTALLAGEPSTFYMDRSIEDKVRAIRGVKAAASQIFLQTAEYGCCSVADMLLIGFDPEHDFTITPWLKRATPALTDIGSDETIVGDRILLRPGQTVTHPPRPIPSTKAPGSCRRSTPSSGSSGSIVTRRVACCGHRSSSGLC